MSQKISKTITYFSIIAVVIGAIFLVNGLILAQWSLPTAPPPGDNVPAPLNVGPDAQGKIGNLGIGVTDPVSNLEIRRDDADSEITFHDPGNVWYTMGIDFSESGRPLRINYGPDPGNTNGMSITSANNIGIGMTNPGTKLEVAGDVRIRGSQLQITRPDTTGGYARGVHFRNIDGTTREAGIGMLGSGQNPPQTLYMAFGDSPWGSGVGIYVKNTGNVGIGTTDPQAALHVAGKIIAEGGELEATGISGGAWQQIINYYACNDSDGGLNYTQAGTVTKQSSQSSDYCHNYGWYPMYTNVREYYCNGNDDCASVDISCPSTYGIEYGCQNGKCQKTCDTANCLAQSIPCAGEWETNCYCSLGTCRCTQNWCGGGPCFAAGTKVTMANGLLKNIEEVIIGEKVLGRDGNINTVLGQQNHPIRSGKIYSINSKIEVTPDHPFLAKDGRWKVIDLAFYQSYHSDFKVEADELRIGDILITQSGEEKVNSIKLVKDKNPEEMVYDLIVDGDQIYIAEGFIVHTE